MLEETIRRMGEDEWDEEEEEINEVENGLVDEVAPTTYKGKRAYFARWYVTPSLKLKHQTQTALADFLNVTAQTIRKWTKGIETDMISSQQDNLLSMIINDALKPNADTRKRELAAKLMGLMKKETEDKTFEPTAENYIKWGRELILRLKQDWVQGGGVCPLCSGHKVLFSDIRMDTEQEHSPDGEVGAVAVPERYDRDIPELQGNHNPQG